MDTCWTLVGHFAQNGNHPLSNNNDRDIDFIIICGKKFSAQPRRV